MRPLNEKYEYKKQTKIKSLSHGDDDCDTFFIIIINDKINNNNNNNRLKIF